MTRDEANDCISRQAAISKVLEYYTECERWKILSFTPNLIKQKVADILSDLPSVQSGRKTGTWKAHEDSKIPGYWHYGCSLCGCEVEKARNYCPNCGARLEGIWLIAKVKRIG